MALTVRERKMVDFPVHAYAELFQDGELTLDVLTNRFKDFAEKNRVDVSAVYLEVEVENGYYDEPATYSLYLRASRPPTEEEIELRTQTILKQKELESEQRKRQKAAREASDRKEYERLKKKYGKEV